MVYPVKTFSSDDVGSPDLSGTAGALINLLDACLLSGYNPRGVDALTWKSGIATAICNSGHGYQEGDIIKIDGSSPAAYNGEWRVKSITSNGFTFEMPGTGIASPASGTISARKAPAGWRKPYVGTNVAAYQSQDVNSPQHFLRVNDSGTRFAWVRGYETMTDIDTGTGLFPTLSQMAATNYLWIKSDAASTAVKSWVVFADSRFFVLVVRPWSAQGCSVVWFGDPVTFDSGDKSATIIQAHASANPVFAGDYGRLYVNGEMTGRYMARGFHGVGGAIQYGLYGNITQTYSGYASGWAFPNQSGSGALVNPLIIGEPNLSNARGILPGLYQVLHNQPLSHGDALKMRALDGSSRNGMLVDFATDNANVRGRAIIDMDGPWR